MQQSQGQTPPDCRQRLIAHAGEWVATALGTKVVIAHRCGSAGFRARSARANGASAPPTDCGARRTGETRQLEGACHTEDIHALDVSPDGRWLLTGAHDKTAKLWSTSTWECAQTLTAPKKVIRVVG